MKILKIILVAVVLAASTNPAKAVMTNLQCQTYMWNAWSQCLGWGHTYAECNPIVDTGIPYCAQAYPT